MALPSCTVITHSDWKKKRDAAGGKSGLSKINMGKKLDDFAAFLKADDENKADAATSALETAAKSYVADVSKKYPRVAAVVTAEILGKLKAFEAKMKARDAYMEDLAKKFKADLMTVISNTKKFIAQLDKVEGELDALIAKFKDGVPPEQAGTLVKVAATYEKTFATISTESWKDEEMAKPLDHYSTDIKDNYKEAIDVATHLLEQRREKLKQGHRLAAQLTQLSKKTK